MAELLLPGSHCRERNDHEERTIEIVAMVEGREKRDGLNRFAEALKWRNSQVDRFSPDTGVLQKPSIYFFIAKKFSLRLNLFA